jgi:hypothetical protein
MDAHLGQYLSVKKMSASYLVDDVKEIGNCMRGGGFRGSRSRLFGLSGLSRLFRSLNQTNQRNQTNQMNQMDQIPATRRKWGLTLSNLSKNCGFPGGKGMPRITVGSSLAARYLETQWIVRRGSR